MPFALRFTYDDGSIKEIKPLACDNPKHDSESPRIATNANRIAGRMNSGNNNFKCSVQHYTDGGGDIKESAIKAPLPAYRKGLGFTVNYYKGE